MMTDYTTNVISALVKALLAYLALDNDLAKDAVSWQEEPERWAECHTLAAEAIRKAGVELPDWLRETVMVDRP